jgi:hypothetical protein
MLLHVLRKQAVFHHFKLLKILYYFFGACSH